MIKIGIVKEGKTPPDFRVPLTPKQCREVNITYQNKAEIVVQRSNIRTFSDEEYEQQGISLVDDLSDCDIIIGVKEVQIDDLIPNKTYLFFSHTIKEQPYNKKLLQAILAKNISLLDYEVIKNEKGKRLIGFGKYAGIVGTYNGFRTYGLKSKRYQLIQAVDTNSLKIVEEELKNVSLPSNFRLVLTGYGRVGHGAREIIDFLPIKEVSKEDFLTKTLDEPVYVHLDTEDYYRRKSDKKFDKYEFYSSPSLYEGALLDFLKTADMYIPCHFWNEHAPTLISADDLATHLQRLSVIADISCDIQGPIASTIRPSTINNPIYGYNKQLHSEDDFQKDGVLAVMAVDNLPCELPKDASKDFGRELISNVLPHLLTATKNDILENARITTLDGHLTPKFKYLTNYVSN